MTRYQAFTRVLPHRCELEIGLRRGARVVRRGYSSGPEASNEHDRRGGTRGLPAGILGSPGVGRNHDRAGVCAN